MKGSIIGDIVGSVYEFNNITTKDFPLFSDKSSFTDDTIMTYAVMKLLNDNYKDVRNISSETITGVFQETARRYPDAGYSSKFIKWEFSDDPQPYNSCGNGSAMWICPVGMVVDGWYDIKELSKKFSEVSHNHPEGFKGARCVALCVDLAKHIHDKERIRSFIEDNYYPLNKTCEDYRRENAARHEKEICQVTVPQAIECFLESTSFEDCIRNCISIGGDSDTIAAIAGGIAEAYYGVPEEIWSEAKKYLPEEIIKEVERFESIYRDRYPHKVENQKLDHFPEGNWESDSRIEIYNEEMSEETFARIKQVIDDYEKNKENPRTEVEYFSYKDDRAIYKIADTVLKNEEDYLKLYAYVKKLHDIAEDKIIVDLTFNDWREDSDRYLKITYDEDFNPIFTLITIMI